MGCVCYRIALNIVPCIDIRDDAKARVEHPLKVSRDDLYVDTSEGHLSGKLMTFRSLYQCIATRKQSENRVEHTEVTRW